MEINSFDLDMLKLNGHWDIQRVVDNCIKGQKFTREILTGAIHLRTTGVREIKQGAYEVKNGERRGPRTQS